MITKPVCHTSLLLMTILLCSCGRVEEAVESPEPVINETVLERHDQDRDGMLSPPEREKMNNEFIAQFDKDDDGVLNAKERNEIRNSPKVKIAVNRKLPPSRASAEAFVARLDKDGDGSISEGETTPQQWKALQRVDTNGDRKISPEEWLESRTSK